MATSRKWMYLVLALGILGVIVAIFPRRSAPRPGPAGTDARRVLLSPPVTHEVRRPVIPAAVPDEVRENDRKTEALNIATPIPAPVPNEVQEFLDRMLQKVPHGGKDVTGYQLYHWKWKDKPTHEAIGLKAIPDVDPDKLIARVMDVDGYEENIAHVESCRSKQDAALSRSRRVRFFQVIRVPGVAKVQQELMLVDAGTIKGYRVAYWYLLKDETEKLDRKDGARSAFNVGAWLVTPGVVGYALSSWPRQSDVNLAQWRSLTTIADLLAKKVIEGNIDGMAAWAKKQGSGDPPSRPVAGRGR